VTWREISVRAYGGCELLEDLDDEGAHGLAAHGEVHEVAAQVDIESKV